MIDDRQTRGRSGLPVPGMMGLPAKSGALCGGCLGKAQKEKRSFALLKASLPWIPHFATASFFVFVENDEYNGKEMPSGIRAKKRRERDIKMTENIR